MECKNCDKSFVDINVLFRHLQVFHPLQTSFTCVYKNCMRRFLSLSFLKKHLANCEKKPELHLVKKKSLIKQSSIYKKEIDNIRFKETPNMIEDKVGNQSEDKSVEDDMFLFIAKLYSNNSITKIVANEIVDDLLKFTGSVTALFKDQLKAKIPMEFHKTIDECLHVNCLDKVNSEFKRLEYFKQSNYFIEPQEFEIGEIDDSKNVSNSTALSKRKCFGYYIPLRFTLKLLFELPNFFKVVTNFIKQEVCQKDEPRIYTSVFSGERWRTISKYFGNKIVVPLFLYYDDFETSDPLSKAAGIYKIGGMYFSIGGLPPKYSSMLENVFLAQFIYTEDQKEFKNSKCFRKILEELNYLFLEGITINVDGKNQQVYFIVIGILGDNLGMNSLLGLHESFVSDYYCRFCLASKYDAYALSKENPELMRTLENYKKDVELRSHGVHTECVFNSLPYFHNVLNWTCDIMHDFYLGVYRYDMAKIIDHCVKEKYFTLNRLNDRLKYFDYTEIDRGSKISSIKASHIKKGYIIITAAQMSALVTYFGIIIGDVIPPDDPVWDFYCILYDVIDLITKSIISQQDIAYLRQLIKEHNELYITLFNEGLKPKFHFIIHYPTCIETMGPLKYLSCEKYEAYHKLPKRHARIVNCRLNLLLTLSNKIQFGLARRFFMQEGLKNKILFGPIIKQLKNQNFVNCKNAIYEISYVKFNSFIYKSNYAIFLYNNIEGDPVIGIISRIVKTVKNNALLVYKKCETIGLDNHTKCCVISMPNSDICEEHIILNYTHTYRPIKIHINANGQNVISRRDLEI